MSTKEVSCAPVPSQFGRRNLFFHGKIEAYGCPAMACVVRDLTPTGATLVVASSLPAHFRLVVEAKGFEGECRIVTQTDRTVEVCFV